MAQKERKITFKDDAISDLYSKSASLSSGQMPAIKGSRSNSLTGLPDVSEVASGATSTRESINSIGSSLMTHEYLPNRKLRVQSSATEIRTSNATVEEGLNRFSEFLLMTKIRSRIKAKLLIARNRLRQRKIAVRRALKYVFGRISNFFTVKGIYALLRVEHV